MNVINRKFKTMKDIKKKHGMNVLFNVFFRKITGKPVDPLLGKSNDTGNERLAQLCLDYEKNLQKHLDEIARHKADDRNRKIAVYTAISNDYDSLKMPYCISDDIDYICFSDRPIRNSGVWKIRINPYQNKNGIITSRYIKMHPHVLLPEYDIAIWMDSNITISGNIMPYINKFQNSGKLVGAMYHPFRENIYQEVEACILKNRESPELMRKQVEYYKNQGFVHNDLTENNWLMFRLHQPLTEKFLDMWWGELERFSKRDQLSFNYCLNRLGIEWFPFLPDRKCARNVSEVILSDHDNNKGPMRKIGDLL